LSRSTAGIFIAVSMRSACTAGSSSDGHTYGWQQSECDADSQKREAQPDDCCG